MTKISSVILASVILGQSAVIVSPPRGPARQTAGSQGGQGTYWAPMKEPFRRPPDRSISPVTEDYCLGTLEEHSPGTDTHLAFAFTVMTCGCKPSKSGVLRRILERTEFLKRFGTTGKGLSAGFRYEGLRATKQYNGVNIPLLPPAT